MAYYATGCTEADLDHEGGLATGHLARNDAELAIISTITATEVELVAALAAIRAAGSAPSCALAADLFNFAAGCAERAARERSDIVDAHFPAAVRYLARRYGAFRTPPLIRCRTRTGRSRPKSRRRCTSRARAPARRDDDPEPPLGRFLAALARLLGRVAR